MSRARIVVPSAIIALLAVGAGSASAAAPGWSTPKVASSTSAATIRDYAAGADGQGVELFASGAVQTRTAQLRAIKTDASEGKAVGVDAGAAGFTGSNLSVDDQGRLVAAWWLDTEGTAPIGLAATLGARTSLPRAATILPTDGQSVSDSSTAIAPDGSGVVAWIQAPAAAGGLVTVKAAKLAAGQAPVVAVLSQRAGAGLTDVSVGVDSNGLPTVTWNVTPTAGGASLVGIARGTAAGAYGPAIEQQVAAGPAGTLQTFVTQTGSLLAFWTEGTGPTAPVTVKTAVAAPGAALAGTKTLVSATLARGEVSFAANAAGRAAVLFPAASGKGTTLRVVLRTGAGNWGSVRTLGQSGRYVDSAGIGVDGTGRVVALWDDGNVSGGQATRILAARSSSASGSIGSYSQVTQRSGDTRCSGSTLVVSSSGDGLGAWQCTDSSKGAPDEPRLARLTAP